MTYKRTWKKNRRKVAILGVLSRAQGPVTYVQVAGSLGIYPARQVARDLQRYVVFGYVRRVKMAGKFRYEITRRGEERLAFFNRRTPDTGLRHSDGHRNESPEKPRLLNF